MSAGPSARGMAVTTIGQPEAPNIVPSATATASFAITQPLPTNIVPSATATASFAITQPLPTNPGPSARATAEVSIEQPAPANPGPSARATAEVSIEQPAPANPGPSARATAQLTISEPAAARAYRIAGAARIPLGVSYRRTSTGWQALGAAPDPAPEWPGMMVGMLNSPQTEANWLAVEAQWGGARCGIRRSYSTGMPTTAPVELSSCYGKRASWHSMKSTWTTMAAGGNDAAVTAFLNSIPADHMLMLTYAHEPENDNPLAEEAARAAEWRAAQSHFYDLVKSIRPQTLVGPILMSYTFEASSGRVWSRWVPPAGKMDFFGLDPYNPYRFPAVGAPNLWRDWPMGTGMQIWQQACDDLGVPGAIGETACHEDESGIGPSRKVAWLNGAIAYAEQHQYTAFCYFNSYKPGDTAEAMMLNSSPQSLAAWADILASRQLGVK